jgi:hypothetical protein
MKRLHIAPLLLTLALASTASVVSAQSTTGTAGAPPMAMKMDRSEFYQMYTYDTVNDMWVMNPGMSPPVGVRSRADVKADRDMFLSMNRYDNATSKWIPLGGTPRNMSTMSREEVRAETANFLRTHRYDEANSKWLMRSGSGAQ